MRNEFNGRPSISVIIIGYRNDATIVAAVESIVNQQCDDEFELVVVDGGLDGAASSARSLVFHRARVIEIESRLMPGGARNVGIAHSSGEFIAFLAADCLAAPGWISARLAAHRQGYEGDQRRQVPD